MTFCANCENSLCPSSIQKFRNWWMKWRSPIAKIWLWTALVGVSVGFGFLWTYCNPPATNPTPDDDVDRDGPCGIVTHWLGIIFIFMIFFVYAIYSLLKDCTCFLYGCFSRNNNSDTTNTQQVHPSSDEGVWESTVGFGLDLPSYEDALEMPKVEQPKAKGQTNPAFMAELPPEYSENDRITYEVRNSITRRETTRSSAAEITPTGPPVRSESWQPSRQNDIPEPEDFAPSD